MHTYLVEVQFPLDGLFVLDLIWSFHMSLIGVICMSCTNLPLVTPLNLICTVMDCRKRHGIAGAMAKIKVKDAPQVKESHIALQMLSESRTISEVLLLLQTRALFSNIVLNWATIFIDAGRRHNLTTTNYVVHPTTFCFHLCIILSAQLKETIVICRYWVEETRSKRWGHEETKEKMRVLKPNVRA